MTTTGSVYQDRNYQARQTTSSGRTLITGTTNSNQSFVTAEQKVQRSRTTGQPISSGGGKRTVVAGHPEIGQNEAEKLASATRQYGRLEITKKTNGQETIYNVRQSSVEALRTRTAEAERLQSLGFTARETLQGYKIIPSRLETPANITKPDYSVFSKGTPGKIEHETIIIKPVSGLQEKPAVGILTSTNIPKLEKYEETLYTSQGRTLEKIGVGFAETGRGVAEVAFIAPAKFLYGLGKDILTGDVKTIEGTYEFGKSVASGEAGLKYGQLLERNPGRGFGQAVGVIFAPKIIGSTATVSKNLLLSGIVTKGKVIYAGRVTDVSQTGKNLFAGIDETAYNEIFLRKSEIGKSVLTTKSYVPGEKVFFDLRNDKTLMTAGSVEESLGKFGSPSLSRGEVYQGKIIVVNPYERIRVSTLKPFPMERGMSVWTDIYEGGYFPVEGYVKRGGVYGQSSASKPLSGEAGGVGKKASTGFEDPGVYHAPIGGSSTLFLRLGTKQPYYGLNPVPFVKSLFQRPTVHVTKAAGIARHTAELVFEPGFEGVTREMTQRSGEGLFWLTKRSELGLGGVPRQTFFNKVKGVFEKERGSSEVEVVTYETKWAFKPAKTITTAEGRAVVLIRGRLLKESPIVGKEPSIKSGEFFKSSEQMRYEVESQYSSVRQPRPPVYTNIAMSKPYTVYGEQYPVYDFSSSSLVPSRVEYPSIISDVSKTSSSTISSSSYTSYTIGGGSSGGGSSGGGSYVPDIVPPPSYVGGSRGGSRVNILNVSLPPNPPIFYPSRSRDYFVMKKYKGVGKRKGRVGRSGVYVLPDLFAVSRTEAFNYAKFGGGEAVAPRLTKDIYSRALSAFKGYGVGRIPTEQIRTGKVKI